MTCSPTSGYEHYFDTRYLWMQLKKITGLHFASYHEAWRANELIKRGFIHPTLSRPYPLDEAPQAAYEMQQNVHHGKIGILRLAPSGALGVTDPGDRQGPGGSAPASSGTGSGSRAHGK